MKILRCFIAVLAFAVAAGFAGCNRNPQPTDHPIAKAQATPSGDPCLAKYIQIRFEPKLKKQDRGKDVLPYWPVANNGERLPYGRYFYISTDDGDYALPFQYRECAPGKWQMPHSGSGISGGMVVQKTGVHYTGSGEVEWFVESPPESGLYKFFPGSER